MEKDATKKRKSEERERKRTFAAEVLSINTKVKQAEQVQRTRSNRVIRRPEQSYGPANERRFKPKVKCDILLRLHATNEFPTDIHFILSV